MVKFRVSFNLHAIAASNTDTMLLIAALTAAALQFARARALATSRASRADIRAPPAAVPASGNYDLVSDCGADPTGDADSTAAINACITAAYDYASHGWLSAAVFVPAGIYTVSGTINMIQANPGPDDGINVVPGRYLPVVLIGSTAALPFRPVFRLAASSPGFNATGGKPVVYNNPGGVSMNNIFKGIDIDITAEGNTGAVGLGMAGAQGTVAHDVTVRAHPQALACFQGINGAGGQHANIRCEGARYGLLVSNGPLNSQPVPSVVGAQLVNQTVSAISYYSQESMSLVGVSIEALATAPGPIVDLQQSTSIVDLAITCGAGSNATAIATTSSLYMQSVYVSGCGSAVQQPSMTPLPSAPAGQWLQIGEWAKGLNRTSPYGGNNYAVPDVIYQGGVRMPGAHVATTAVLPAGTQPPADLVSQHLWDEATFPAPESAGVANAKTQCGAAGDNATDDTAALQGCLANYTRVYLPRGVYRVSSTITIPAGGALVGVGNTISVIAAATTGMAGASASNPVPVVATSNTDADAAPTVIAFVGITIFQHLPNTYALDWATRNANSTWRVGYESRPCECLWTTAWQVFDPPAIPCALPVNITVPKSVFRGLGRIYSWVTDDTGGILSTGATYRHMVVRDTTAFASPTARTRFYSLNLEHAMSEANGEVSNASFVDIYSVKAEGNAPILWIRGGAANVSVLSLGGGLTPFPYNFTFPPDFTPSLASVFRVDAGCGVKFANLLDHGYGTSPPYWPPTGYPKACNWERHFPYPGAAVDVYPYSTYPNATMWNCWFGEQTATAYWWMIVAGNTSAYGDGTVGQQLQQQSFTTPMDKPILYTL